MVADLVIRGATVWGRPDASAIAIRSGRVVAVGPDEEPAGLTGSTTRVIEARGRTVLPGFQDAHVHPPFGGLALLRCNLHDCRSTAEVVDAVRSYVGGLEPGEWILGSGWDSGYLGENLDRTFLDTITSGHPTFLLSGGLHDAWVNSSALEVAGIRDDAADPAFGELGRRPDGSLSGLLHEGAVMLVESAMPALTTDELERALLAAQSHLHALGITAWQDAWTTPEVLRAYRSLAETGRLTARVVTSLWWDRYTGAEQIEQFVESRTSSTVGRLSATTVKIMVDGTTGNYSAALVDPYLVGDGTNTGMLFLSPDDLRAAVARLDGLGFQVHFHAIGDRAVRESLDAVAHAQRVNGKSARRHHIAHVCLVQPSDIPRFAELDVAANIQPYWATANEDMIHESRFLGEERSRWWYPFESLRRAGARLAGGSDWPVSTADPLIEIAVAVDREVPGSGTGLFLPDERLSLEHAVDAFTAGAAYVNGLDGETGEVRVGALADLVLVDQDLTRLAAREFADCAVVLTLVDGEPVFEAAGVD